MKMHNNSRAVRTPTNRKGFMKALEGILAAVLLLGYTSSFFTLEPSNAEWEKVHTQQQGQEYLSVLGKTQLSDLVLKNKKTEFLDITQYFLGSGKGYSLETENIVDHSIRASVILEQSSGDTPTETVDANESCSFEGGCYPLTFRGTQLWVVDVNEDGRQEYTAVYKGATPSQGPFYTTDFVPLDDGTIWQVGRIQYSGNVPSAVTFFNTTGIFKIKNALEPDFRLTPFSINGRVLDIRVIGSLISDDTLEDNDLLFLTDTFVINETTYPILASLVSDGMDIIAFVTAETALTPEFRTLTNSRIVSYTPLDQGDETVLANVSFENDLYEVPRYMSAIGLDANTQSPGHTGEVTLGDTLYEINVTNSTPSGTYDRLNIEEEASPLAVGETFTKNGSTYTVGYIHPDGYFVTLELSSTHRFQAFSLPEQLVSANHIEDEFILYDRTGKYAYPGEPAGMTEGETYPDDDQQFAGISYSISLAPPSITFNGTVYPNNATIQIGPDTFRAYIIDDDLVWWELVSRWRIPYGISNHDSQGTVLLLPQPQSDDEWAYVRSAAFQLLKDLSEIVRSTYGKRGSISVTDTFIAADDFYQVYEVIFRVWY